MGIFALPAIAIVVAIAALTRSHHPPASKTQAGSAFNTSLPNPSLPKVEKNKLEIYMQAQQDSLKQRMETSKDPYAQLAANPAGPVLPGKAGLSSSEPLHASPPSGEIGMPDDNDRKISERVQKIYAAIGTPDRPVTSDHAGTIAFSNPPLLEASPSIARLERMMSDLHEKDTTTDPKLRQVKDVLDQIMALKYPDRVPASAQAGNRAPTILPVESSPRTPSDTITTTYITAVSNGFYGLTDEPDSLPHGTSGLQAVIHSNQVVQTGATVKLRLLQPIYVGGQEIPANSFIFGPATISGERVNIQLTNAIYNGRIFPIALKVYDGTDGLEGLYVPGMITRDVVKQNMSQGVSGMNIGSLDPSLGAQAATAAIETARNLISKKISIVKATLKAGHIAILKPAGTNY